MTSGYIPEKEEPGFDAIRDALRDALADNPRLAEIPEEEIARQLVLEGRLQDEPSPPLVTEALQAIEIEEEEVT